MWPVSTTKRPETGTPFALSRSPSFRRRREPCEASHSSSARGDDPRVLCSVRRSIRSVAGTVVAPGGSRPYPEDVTSANRTAAVKLEARSWLECDRCCGIGPAQHAKRAQRVPSARFAGAAFHLEVHRTRMRVLERPTPVIRRASSAPDRSPRPCARRVRRRPAAGSPGPTGCRSASAWETKSRSRRRASGLSVERDDLSGRSRSEQAALEEILLSAKASGGDVGPRTLRRLVLQQSFEHADRRVERRSLAARGVAVPAAVAQLLLKQSVGETIAVPRRNTHRSQAPVR